MNFLCERCKQKYRVDDERIRGRQTARFNCKQCGHVMTVPVEPTDEVVMLGAHFDSWHGGTGATDNAAGSAVMMEAMRILKQSGLPLRRTVRIALWGGEEQGLGLVGHQLGPAGVVGRHQVEGAAEPRGRRGGGAGRHRLGGLGQEVDGDDVAGIGRCRHVHGQIGQRDRAALGARRGEVCRYGGVGPAPLGGTQVLVQRVADDRVGELVAAVDGHQQVGAHQAGLLHPGAHLLRQCRLQHGGLARLGRQPLRQRVGGRVATVGFEHVALAAHHVAVVRHEPA